MFGRKQKEIKRLQSLIYLKEAERKTAWEMANEDKKRLAAALRDKGMMRAALYENREAFHKKDERISELKALYLEACEAEKTAKRGEAEKRKKIYQACAKMRAAIRNQQQYIDVLTNNINALGVTIEEMQKECAMRYNAECALRGKVEVYELFLGKVKQDDDRVLQEEVSGEAEGGQPDGDAAAETEGQKVGACDVQQVLDDAD